MSADEQDKIGGTRSRNFKLQNEDHTMGTILTYILDRLPETEFCAYTIKHPTENDLYIRLKVKEGFNVNTVFQKGIVELKKALEVVEEKFNDAFSAFQEEKQSVSPKKEPES